MKGCIHIDSFYLIDDAKGFECLDCGAKDLSAYELLSGLIEADYRIVSPERMNELLGQS
jgi:hypothetical protein